VTEQEKEITQPVVVNGSITSPPIKEGTQPVKVADDAAQTQLPEWLLKFAASQEQSAEENEPGTTLDFQVPFLGDVEEGQVFTPPEIIDENEWQEIADFEDQEELDLEPVLEAEVITSDVEAFKAPESDLDANPDEVAEPEILVDPQVEAAENFKQEVRDLLKQGQHEQALAMIRESKTDPMMAEAAKKTLRSQLTLSPDTSDLWDVYDELNSSSL